jgi:trimethylamine--corrinoid protein Co-methyltransferase
MFGTSSVSDAIIPDEQSAIEVTISCFLTLLSGANAIHDVGLIGSATVLSLEVSVMTNEIVSMIKHIMKGVEVNEETLSLDLIDKIGPTGHYLYEEHTMKHFKDYFYPELLNRKKYDQWVNEGSRSYRDKLQKKVMDIIENHIPENPLKDNVLLKINDLEKKWRGTN